MIKFYPAQNKTMQAFVRLRWIADALNAKKLATCIVAGRDKGVEKEQKLNGESDVIVLHAPMTQEHYEFCKETKDNKWAKVVVDFDDNPFRVSPFNNAYRFGGVEEVKFQDKWLWKDGQDGFDIERNWKTRECITETVKLADLVTVTVEPLAKTFRQYNPCVEVLPNCLDLSVWDDCREYRQNNAARFKDQFRIGYWGGSSHYEDFQMIAGLWPRLMEKYPQVKLVTFGTTYAGTLKQIPKGRIEYFSWVDVLRMPYKAATLGLHAGICPLVDNEFNRCKSAIKWLEYSALGIPTVASNCLPYSAAIEHGRTGLLAEPYADHWEKCLSKLIENPTLAAGIADAATFEVYKKYGIATQCHRWLAAYERLMT